MRARKTSSMILFLLLFAAFTFYPLDIYISKPGSAYDLEPLVNVVDGDKDDEGSFSLMTIALSKATSLTYVHAQISDRRKILPPAAVRQEDEGEEEYNVRQKNLMTTSQYNATYVAFTKLGLPFEEKFEGFLVMSVQELGASDQLLIPGDNIKSIDEKELSNIEDFLAEIASKDDGDKVILQVNRDGDLLDVEVTLREMPNEEGRIGLGIVLQEERSIKTNPEVIMKASNIGGPSAGLMYSLEIMNQIEEEDLTKGYAVAGTGTIESDGSVGRIGGMDFKVIAADHDEIDIFFAPDDDVSAEKKERPTIISNYEEAKRTAEAIGTEMKIVPVKTIDDALHYLNELPPK